MTLLQPQARTLTIDGDTYSVEELHDRHVNSKQHELLAYSPEGFIEISASCMEILILEAAKRSYKLTFNTGETLNLLEDDKVVNLDGEWVQVQQITEGEVITALTYNPVKRHPEVTPKTITNISTRTEHFVPLINLKYGQHESSGLMVCASPNQSNNSDRKVLLIPITQ